MVYFKHLLIFVRREKPKHYKLIFAIYYRIYFVNFMLIFYLKWLKLSFYFVNMPKYHLSFVFDLNLSVLFFIVFSLYLH